MKIIIYMFMAFYLLLPSGASASMQGAARIMLVEGDVQVRMSDSDDWVPAAPNTPLEEGDSVWSPEGSRVEIQLQDGAYIRLADRSALDIVDVSENVLQFHLGMGRAYVRTGPVRRWSYQFDLTESTVTFGEKTRVRLDIAADGDEDISVIKGTAYVEGYGTKTRVRSGEMISLEDSRSELLPLKPADDWERWNRKRDQQLKARASASGRLPDELGVYEDELARSGEWVEVKEHGRIWRPTVVVTAEWAPYQVGRWIWRGGDYVWISYESWGWAPYHYGRWVILPRWGWCWVPPRRGDVFWAPAYVGWVTTPHHVGWVPLAPGETYYGRGYYGRGSVNITHVTNINVTNVVYRNQRVNRNALTVVQRDSFATERMHVVRTRENILSHERASVSRPEPPATRAARMPVVRQIPAEKLPPPRVANVPARELKNRLPRIDQPVGAPAAVPGASRPAGRERVPRQELPSVREKREQLPQAGEQRPPATRQPTGQGSVVAPSTVTPRDDAATSPPAARPSAPEQRRERRMQGETAQPLPADGQGIGRQDAPGRGQSMERRAPRQVWEVRPKENRSPRNEGRQGRPAQQRERRER